MEVPKKPKPFSVLDKVLDWINVFSLLSVAVLMFVQVILRYVLKMPLMGIEELCYFPTVWLYLFAAVKASSERGQLVPASSKFSASGNARSFCSGASRRSLQAPSCCGSHGGATIT